MSAGKTVQDEDALEEAMERPGTMLNTQSHRPIAGAGWELPGKGRGKGRDIWEIHGKSMGNPWEIWENPGNSLEN